MADKADYSGALHTKCQDHHHVPRILHTKEAVPNSYLLMDAQGTLDYQRLTSTIFCPKVLSLHVTPLRCPTPSLSLAQPNLLGSLSAKSHPSIGEFSSIYLRKNFIEEIPQRAAKHVFIQVSSSYAHPILH